GNAYLDGSGRHGGHALGHQSNRYSFDRDIANDDRTLVTTSLLNPHPAIIPPPGSRLAFAGADSRVTINKFRSLPSLEDTLLRRAKAPLCLYNYWQYLADIESCPEELEFWLSLADYEELHRRFTDSKPPVPSSGITPQNKRQRSQFLSIATGGSRFTSMRIDNGTADKHHIQEGAPATTGTELVTKGQQNAAYDNLDMDTQLLDSYLADLSYQTATAVEGSKCSIHRQCRSLHCPFTSGLLGGAPILDTPVRVTHTRGVRGFFSRIFSGESNANSVDVSQAGSVGHRGDNLAAPLLSSITSSSQEILKPGLHKQPHAVITEDEIRHSAEQLYFQYVLPGAPSELFLGPQMREDIASRIENERRYDAELFAPAKRHAYEAMRHESYPRFLRERL
ncbi:Bud site selection protein, Revert to axial protein 1, partial [Dipsacomyces acuminosporus]